MLGVHVYLHHVGQKCGAVLVAAWKFKCRKGCDNFLYCLCQPDITSALFYVVFSLLEKSLQFLCQCGSELKFSNDEWVK